MPRCSSSFIPFVTVLLVCCMQPRPVRAEPPAVDLFTTRRVSAVATLGVGSPTGVLGGELEVAPLPWLALYAGGGIGLEQHLQLAAGGRLRWSMGTWALGAGLGASTGDAALYATDVTDGVFVNAEALIEWRFESGLLVRGTLGAETLQSWDSCDHTGWNDEMECTPGETLPYASVSVGATF